MSTLKSIAAPVVVGNYTAALDVRDLEQSACAFMLSKALAAGDQVNAFGVLDSASVGTSPNLTPLGDIFGSIGQAAPARPVADLWPYLLFQRVSGTTAGTIYAAGPTGISQAVSSTAAPAAGSFTAAIDLRGLGPRARVGLSAALTGSDFFDIYGTCDSSATALPGTIYLGRIAGGGGGAGVVAGAPSSLVVQDWPYILVYRPTTSGATAGNVLAWGQVEPITVPASIDPIPLTLAERDATGALRATDFNGGPGATASFGAAADDHTTIVGSVTGTSATTIRGGTGDMNIRCGRDMILNAGRDCNVLAQRNVAILCLEDLLLQCQGSAPKFALLDNASGGACQIDNSGGGDTEIRCSGGGSITASCAAGITMTSSASSVQLNAFAAIGLRAGAFGVVLQERGVAPGDGGQIALRELLANGTNATGFKAPDSLLADAIYTMPAAFPTITGQSLRGTTAGVMSWGGAVNVQAATTNAQSIGDGVAAAIVTTWTEVTDTAAAFVATSGIFTVPAGGGGFYIVTGEVEFAAIASVVGGEFTVAIFKNGAAVATGVEICQVAAANVKRNPKVCLGLALAAGDTIDLRVTQSSGSGANALTAVGTRNTISIAQVSG